MDKKLARSAAVVIVGVGACAAPVLGWWPLAHSLIGVKGGPAVSPGYHQIPDIWPSRTWDWENLGVTDEFCWTHVNRRSYAGAGFRKVVKPTYYTFADQRIDNDPAEHMRKLYLKLRTDRRTVSMYNLFPGFAAHNAEDQAGPTTSTHVHFDLAPGAEFPLDFGKWSIHKDVEKAVEVVAYVEICYGGDEYAAFDAYGNPVGFPNSPIDYTVIKDATSGDVHSDGMLCLAMKAFRKKQQTVDTIELKALECLPRSQITTLRTSGDTKIDMSTAALLNFNMGDYVDANNALYGDPPIWPEAPYWRDYFDQAVEDANAIPPEL